VDRLDTAFRQADSAVREGDLSDKEKVLLQALLLYDPAQIPTDSPYRLAESDNRHPRLYYRELLADVQRLFDELSPEEREDLATLHPALARRLARAAAGRPLYARTAPRPATAYERVAEAQAGGKIRLEEAVLAKAALLFAPETLSLDSPFVPLAGEEPGSERCLTGFYKDVHRAFPRLTPEERDFLRGLEPSLASIMDTLGREASGMRSVKALPNYPDLDKKVVGDQCIVHYTDSQDSRNMILNADFPKKVKEAMDQAIAAMPPHFRKGIPEGGGKMQVYVVRMPQGTFGETIAASRVDDKKRRVYIKITPGLYTRGGADWEMFVRGTVFHEYHHAIQGAYNWTMSDWACECLSEWASCYYAKWWYSPGDAYTYDASIFNTPEWPLWYTSGNREYSTSALAFFLGHRYGGYRFMKSWMEFAEVNSDAIRAMNSLLVASHDSDFRKEYRPFLAALHTKAIPSIKAVMPPVRNREILDFGIDPQDNSVFQTGARYYLLKPKAGAEGTTLIAQFAPKPGWLDKLEAFLIVDNKEKLHPIRDKLNNGFVKQFGPRVKEVMMVATDARYRVEDVAARPYELAFSVPHAVIEGVEPEYGPIVEGQTFNIFVPMEISGVYPTKDYPSTIEYWFEVGDQIRIHEVIETQLPPPPAGLQFEVQTTTGYAGKGQFIVQVRMPSDTWKVPQVKTAGECPLEIVPAAGRSSVMQYGFGPPDLFGPSALSGESPETLRLPAPISTGRVKVTPITLESTSSMAP
jgi:hypothetical protein